MTTETYGWLSASLETGNSTCFSCQRACDLRKGYAESQDQNRNKGVCGDKHCGVCVYVKANPPPNPSKCPAFLPNQNNVTLKENTVLLIVEVYLSLLTYQTEVLILSLLISWLKLTHSLPNISYSWRREEPLSHSQKAWCFLLAMQRIPTGSNSGVSFPGDQRELQEWWPSGRGGFSQRRCILCTANIGAGLRCPLPG